MTAIIIILSLSILVAVSILIARRAWESLFLSFGLLLFIYFSYPLFIKAYKDVMSFPVIGKINVLVGIALILWISFNDESKDPWI
jgi:hypothetical protein